MNDLEVHYATQDFQGVPAFAVTLKMAGCCITEVIPIELPPGQHLEAWALLWSMIDMGIEQLQETIDRELGACGFRMMQ